QIHHQFCVWIFYYRLKNSIQEFIGNLYREQTIVQRISFKYVRKETTDYHIKTIVLYCPGSMLSTTTTAKVLTRYENFSAIGRIVHHKTFLRLIIAVVAPITE